MVTIVLSEEKAALLRNMLKSDIKEYEESLEAWEIGDVVLSEIEGDPFELVEATKRIVDICKEVCEQIDK